MGQRTESLIFTKREFQSNVEIVLIVDHVGKTLHVAIKDNFFNDNIHLGKHSSAISDVFPHILIPTPFHSV